MTDRLIDGWWNCYTDFWTASQLTHKLVDRWWLTDSLIYRLTYCCTDRLWVNTQTKNNTVMLHLVCFCPYHIAEFKLMTMYLGQLLLCSTWMTFENSFLHQCLDCKMHQVTWELAHHLNESGPLYSFKIGEAFHLMITPIPKHWRYNPSHTLSLFLKQTHTFLSNKITGESFTRSFLPCKANLHLPLFWPYSIPLLEWQTSKSLTLYTRISVCIISTLFSIHFLRCWKLKGSLFNNQEFLWLVIVPIIIVTLILDSGLLLYH